MNEKYTVSIEFPNFSKRFEHVTKPRFESYGNTTMLMVDDEDKHRTVCFNFRHVQYYTLIKEND